MPKLGFVLLVRFYFLPSINHHEATIREKHVFSEHLKQIQVNTTHVVFFHFVPWLWRFIVAMSKISCVWVLMKCLRKGHAGRWCWFLTRGARPMVLDGGLKDFYYPRIAERIQWTRLVSRNVERICICSCSNMFASPSEKYCSVFWFPIKSMYIYCIFTNLP